MKTFTKCTAMFYATLLSMFQLICGCSSVPIEPTAGIRYVDEFDLASATCGLGKKVRAKTSVDGNPLVAGRNKATSLRGFGAHAESAVAFRFNGKVTAFDARIGLDADSQKANTWKHHYIGARFRVWADGRIAYDSGTIRDRDNTKDIHVDLAGAYEVILETTSPIGWLSYVGGNADWLDARFTYEAGATLECLNVTELSKQIGVLTPPESPKPQFNGANVWGVRPGHEVIFRVPVSGKRPMKFTAENLPDGVTFDERKGVLRGTAPQMKGRYPVTVTAENECGKASATITLCVGDTLALTPPMGWNSWNYCCWTLTQKDAMEAARALDETGLADYGWAYVNLDDWWQMNNSGNDRSKTRSDVQGPARAKDGTILPNRGFTDMKAFTDYCHSLGLKAGIYSSPGPLTCGECEGSLGHEAQDAAMYAKWGFDYIKYDWCSYNKIFAAEMKGRKPTDEDYAKPYLKMGKQLAAQNRDIVYSLCEMGFPNVKKWGRKVGGNLFRTGSDMKDCWMWMRDSIEGATGEYDSWTEAGPGYWGDPDMMLIGLQRSFGTVHPTYLTPNEQYTHVSLWSLMCAPLLLGCDLWKLDDFTMSLIKNREIIAINQDTLGKPAQRIVRTDSHEIWKRPLSNGDFAVGIVNLYPLTKRIDLNFSDIGLEGAFRVRDVWRQKDEGVFSKAYCVELPPHATKVIRMRLSDCATCE